MYADPTEKGSQNIVELLPVKVYPFIYILFIRGNLTVANLPYFFSYKKEPR